MTNNAWPSLVLEEWQDTLATLHMWTQIVGKTRLKLTPLVNHWWNVPLYVSARGLTTSPMPYDDRIFEIEFRRASFGFASLPESGAGHDYWRPYLAKPHSEAGIRSFWFGIETPSRG